MTGYQKKLITFLEGYIAELEILEGDLLERLKEVEQQSSSEEDDPPPSKDLEEVHIEKRDPGTGGDHSLPKRTDTGKKGETVITKPVVKPPTLDDEVETAITALGSVGEIHKWVRQARALTKLLSRHADVPRYADHRFRLDDTITFLQDLRDDRKDYLSYVRTLDALTEDDDEDAWREVADDLTSVRDSVIESRDAIVTLSSPGGSSGACPEWSSILVTIDTLLEEMEANIQRAMAGWASNNEDEVEEDEVEEDEVEEDEVEEDEVEEDEVEEDEEEDGYDEVMAALSSLSSIESPSVWATRQGGVRTLLSRWLSSSSQIHAGRPGVEAQLVALGEGAGLSERLTGLDGDYESYRAALQMLRTDGDPAQLQGLLGLVEALKKGIEGVLGQLRGLGGSPRVGAGLEGFASRLLARVAASLGEVAAVIAALSSEDEGEDGEESDKREALLAEHEELQRLLAALLSEGEGASWRRQASTLRSRMVSWLAEAAGGGVDTERAEIAGLEPEVGAGLAATADLAGVEEEQASLLTIVGILETEPEETQVAALPAQVSALLGRLEALLGSLSGVRMAGGLRPALSARRGELVALKTRSEALLAKVRAAADQRAIEARLAELDRQIERSLAGFVGAQGAWEEQSGLVLPLLKTWLSENERLPAGGLVQRATALRGTQVAVEAGRGPARSLLAASAELARLEEQVQSQQDRPDLSAVVSLVTALEGLRSQIGGPLGALQAAAARAGGWAGLTSLVTWGQALLMAVEEAMGAVVALRQRATAEEEARKRVSQAEDLFEKVKAALAALAAARTPEGWGTLTTAAVQAMDAWEEVALSLSSPPEAQQASVARSRRAIADGQPILQDLQGLEAAISQAEALVTASTAATQAALAQVEALLLRLDGGVARLTRLSDALDPDLFAGVRAVASSQGERLLALRDRRSAQARAQAAQDALQQQQRAVDSALDDLSAGVSALVAVTEGSRHAREARLCVSAMDAWLTQAAALPTPHPRTADVQRWRGVLTESVEITPRLEDMQIQSTAAQNLFRALQAMPEAESLREVGDRLEAVEAQLSGMQRGLEALGGRFGSPAVFGGLIRTTGSALQQVAALRPQVAALLAQVGGGEGGGQEKEGPADPVERLAEGESARIFRQVYAFYERILATRVVRADVPREKQQLQSRLDALKGLRSGLDLRALRAWEATLPREVRAQDSVDVLVAQGKKRRA